jgi:adenylate cyclase
MTLVLRDLEACFEGVIPSIVATADADGVPNISYLSHVAMVDEEHVALSNQFFAKTAANIRLNPQATLLLVDGYNGTQFRLELVFTYSAESGSLFDHLSLQLNASSAQVGMADVMRLRYVDVFRVLNIERLPSPVKPVEARLPERRRLVAISHVIDMIAEQSDADGIVNATLQGIRTWLGFEYGLFLQCFGERNQVVTIGSLGYAPSGIGSDVPIGEGLIGAAAASSQTVKVSDMSRVRRFGSAVRDSMRDENRTRSILLPGMPDAMSQIAVPLALHNIVQGVLYFESRKRLAFTTDDEAALLIIARHVAVALALNERMSLESELSGLSVPVVSKSGSPIHVVYHQFDDSVFIDNIYVIKGVAGRLLIFMLEQHLANGRLEFTNREIRLNANLRLPDFKDNLETRLLLLRRRLDEKLLAIRLIRLGRGKISLCIEGHISVTKPRS